MVLRKEAEKAVNDDVYRIPTYITSEQVLKAWSDSYAMGVSREKSAATVCNAIELIQAQEAWAELYLYAHRAAKSQMGRLSEQAIGIALFNQDGYMLRLYIKNDQLEQALIQRRLIPGSRWDLASLGANAVSIGILDACQITMEGKENFCECLHEVMTSFSPVVVETTINWAGDSMVGKNQKKLVGGVALLYQDVSNRELCNCIAYSIAREISGYYYLLFATHRLLSLDNRAILAVNVDYHGTYSIFNYNKNTFRVFGMEPRPLFGQRLDSIIDCSKDNMAFWNIIFSGESKKNVSIPLRINGVVGKYIVNVLHDINESAGINDITLIVSSEEIISHSISKKIGNNAHFTFSNIIGRAPAFRSVVKQAELMAESDNNILILGESGTGKDVFAQAIHNASARRNQPFIAINCAAIPRELLASEFFGYADGAFTGARRGGNIGKFELANNGTLFLDEIGDLPMDLQAMLLRVLENRRFMRLGATTETKVDVKIISATNANLMERISQQKFRADLYFRLGTLQISLPPLRERGQDIILLAEHFLKQNEEKTERKSPILSQGAKEALLHQHWHGNIRALQNLVESLSLQYSGEIITYEHIQEYFATTFRGNMIQHEQTDKIQSTAEEYVFFKRPPKSYLISLLEKKRFNKTAVAKELGVSRKTLYLWMAKYGI